MKHNINALLDKYWEGESSTEDDQILKSYFQSEDISDDHFPFRDLFAWIDDTSAVTSPISTDIDSLLDKYWEGESSPKEEALLKAYFSSGHVAEDYKAFIDLFAYFDNQSQVQYKPQTTEKHKDNVQSGARIVKMSIHKWIYAVAAATVLVLGAIFVMNNMNPEKQNTLYSNVQEIEDPEEALRVTKEALALVSTKFRKSQESIKQNISALEKAAIFK